MHTLSPEFSAHIASGETTLCTCWKLTRTDGETLGFTDHDQSLSFDGQSFDPMTGWQGSAVEDTLGAAIDTSEVIGVLRADQISASDIARGRYDGASVETFRVNWKNPDIRLQLRADTLGEITQQDGVFRAELRGAESALNKVSGRLFQYGCDAQLGDGRCTIDLEAGAHHASLTIAQIVDGYRIKITGLSGFDSNWFSSGSLVWTSGVHDKIRNDIIAHTGELLTFAQNLTGLIEVGDTATIYAGCHRDFATCRDKFANQQNFRGFPHMPGNDFAMGYPVPGAARYDGGSLNK